jgi:hypothetical protein
LNDQATICYFFGRCWLIYTIPILLICVPVWIVGRHHATWFWSDYALAVVPFVVWGVCMSLVEWKTYWNLLEGEYIGYLVPFAPIMRVMAVGVGREKVLSITLLIAFCVLAATMGFLIGPIWSIQQFSL